MKIIVAGCGKVGDTIVEQLSLEDRHEISVIDQNPDALAKVCDTFDVMGVVGNAASYETQQERFRADAAERIIGLLEGDDAALENSIRARLFNHRHLLPEDRTVTIVMSRNRLDIAIAPRASGTSDPEVA